MEWHSAIRLVAAGVLMIGAAAVLSSCSSDVRRPEGTEEVVTEPAPFEALNPYGEWVDIPGRGNVWRPHVTYDWSPYSIGRWIWTDRGWAWDSDEPFGWIVYHYGEWDYRPGMGWIWIPGYDWSPARVRWNVSDDLVGWAPMPPPDVILPGPGDVGGEQWWCVVHTGDFCRDRVGSFRAGEPQRFNGTVGKQPPDVHAVETMAGRPIPARRYDTERVKSGTHFLTRFKPRKDQPLRPPSVPQSGGQAVPIHSPTNPTPPTPPVSGKQAVAPVTPLPVPSMPVKPVQPKKPHSGKQVDSTTTRAKPVVPGRGGNPRSSTMEPGKQKPAAVDSVKAKGKRSGNVR